MKPFTSWFQNVVTKILDPDRESRVQTLVNVIERGIQVHGRQFTLRATLGDIKFASQDLEEAKFRIYRAALERGWKDGLLTTGEQKLAQWLASSLELKPHETQTINFEQAQRCFGLALSKAMADGVLQPEEENHLRAVAAAVGCELPAFARQFFRTEGEALLRSCFLACIADNYICQSDWDYLLHVTRQFGLEHHEMLMLVQPQAIQFVEHMLADAKSDGRITPHEQQTLYWLLENLQIPTRTRDYVIGELQLVQTLADIEDGKLPSLGIPQGMERRSGEIMHWFGPVIWRELRLRSNGPKSIDHHGMLAITDNRLIFSSDMKSNAFSHRKIVSHRGAVGWMEVQLEGKPVAQYHFQQPSPLPYSILRSAVAMANQTKLAKSDGGMTRHIPRDVRQRVWQKYGGRCAECSADTYLEFDHIIPFSRGGSNADANIQLLCRMCNLKKSDSI